jgi:hypothetical protein
MIRNNVSAKISKLRNGAQTEGLNVHIFCTLGGGTGSGGVIDTITLIHDLAKIGNFDPKIFLYTFIGGGLQGQASNTGSFFENEYAALRDINALIMGSYHPYVVAGQGKGENFTCHESPIKSVIISTNVTNGDLKLNKQVEHIAQSCFDAILYRFNFTNPDCLKAFSGEDLVDVTPGEPGRSYRFATYAAKSWTVPTGPIRDLLKNEYKKRLMTSLLKGVQPAQDSRTLQSLGDISDLLKQTKTWELLDKLYQDVIEANSDSTGSTDDVLDQLKKRSDHRLDRIKKMETDEAVQTELQSVRQLDVKTLIASVVQLFDDKIQWKPGVPTAWGLEDFNSVLDAYSKQVRPQWPASAQAKDVEELKRDDADICKQMENRKVEWKKMGPLTIKLTSLDEEMIKWQSQDADKRVELAYRSFKKKALVKLTDEFVKSLISFKTKVEAAIKAIKATIKDCENTSTRIKIDLNAKSSSTVGANMLDDIYEFDANNLEKVQGAIEKEDTFYQDQMARIFTPAWTEGVGSLINFEENKTLDTFYQAIDDKLYEASKDIQDYVCQQKTLNNMLIQSIFDRLEQYGSTATAWNEKLTPKVESLTANSRDSATLRPFMGLDKPQRSPVRALVVGFPRAAGNHGQLYQWLQNKINISIPADKCPFGGRQDFYLHDSESEIRVLSLPYWMPARFAKVVDTVYEKYRATAQSTGGDVTLYFANIDEDDYSLTSSIRPALTLDGEPDEDTMLTFEVAKSLYYRYAETKSYPIISMTRPEDPESPFKLLQGVNSFGMADYGKEWPYSKQSFPDNDFKTALGTAIKDMANKTMTEDDKNAVVQSFADKYKKLVETTSPTDPKVEEAQKKFDLVCQLLNVPVK